MKINSQNYNTEKSNQLTEDPQTENITKFLKADFNRLQDLDKKLKIINMSYKFISITTCASVFIVLAIIIWLRLNK